MKRALVVIDMQNDFVGGSLANPEAQAIVPLIVDAIEEFDGEIILTYDTHPKNYLATAEGQKLPIEHCIKDTHGWCIVDEIFEAADVKGIRDMIYKPTFGITKGWHLSEFDEIVLVGTCTDVCVISNALILKALYPEKEIIVDSSCCAGTTVDNHMAALNVMRACQITVV